MGGVASAQNNSTTNFQQYLTNKISNKAESLCGTTTNVNQLSSITNVVLDCGEGVNINNNQSVTIKTNLTCLNQTENINKLMNDLKSEVKSDIKATAGALGYSVSDDNSTTNLTTSIDNNLLNENFSRCLADTNIVQKFFIDNLQANSKKYCNISNIQVSDLDLITNCTNNTSTNNDIKNSISMIRDHKASSESKGLSFDLLFGIFMVIGAVILLFGVIYALMKKTWWIFLIFFIIALIFFLIAVPPGNLTVKYSNIKLKPLDTCIIEKINGQDVPKSIKIIPYKLNQLIETVSPTDCGKDDNYCLNIFCQKECDNNSDCKSFYANTNSRECMLFNNTDFEIDENLNITDKNNELCINPQLDCSKSTRDNPVLPKNNLGVYSKCYTTDKDDGYLLYIKK